MSVTEYTILREHMCRALFPSVVVAIPAQNEEDRIIACVDAIAKQRQRNGETIESVGIVILVNNTSDETFGIARAYAETSPCSIRLYDVAMAPGASHAGGARRAAMNLAADWLDEGGQRDGVIFTTDADSVPAPDWIASMQAAFARGVDGVAGTIDLHPQDEAALPAHVRARGKDEARYDQLLTELFSLLDPRPHDPWPGHAVEAGANLAVTLCAYRAIGGLPDLPCGEDRALVARLERSGFLVRHEPASRVSTSGRLTGRAAGGVADTIRLRCNVPDALCDDYLEPAWNARFRGLWRGRLRAIFARTGGREALKAFGLPETDMNVDGSFQTLWNALEGHDPRLRRRPLRPSQLKEQIAAATIMVERCRRSVAPTVRTDPADSPLFVPAE